jgi:hypothetical protein
VLNNPGTSQPLFVRGFKVHVNPVDPTASPLVADTINIEIARYAGSISNASTSGFTYTRTFGATHASDDYTINLDYISSTTPNGYDDNNNPVTGFKWWYFAQPTSTLTSGTNAASTFVSATNGLLSYGPSCVPAGFTAAITPTAQPVVGVSYANWNDSLATANTWSAFWTVLLPTPAPLSTVGTASGASFTMTPVNSTGTTGCSTPVTVDLDTTSGQATLVYQVNRSSSGVITVTSLGDISQTSVLGSLDTALATGTPVKVYGVPVAASGNGLLKAYVLFYFTGNVLPNQ